MHFDRLYRSNQEFTFPFCVKLTDKTSILFNQPEEDKRWATYLDEDTTWEELFNAASLTMDEGQRLFNSMVSGVRAYIKYKDDEELRINGSEIITYREARNFYLTLVARIECKARKYRSFKPGDIVFPSFVDVTEGPAPEAMRNKAQIGIVIDTQGSKVLVLWEDSGNYSVREADIIRVDYNMTVEEFDKLWDCFGYKENWSKDKCRPECVKEAMKTKSTVAKVNESLSSSRMFRHYWELKDTVLKNGDIVVLFDKYILKVWQHRFDDTTTTDEKQMWWARRCAEYLKVDFDTEFFPLAERLGFYKWKDHPADKLRYQWQYTTYNNATAWALWMLAISDMVEISAGLPNWRKPRSQDFWGYFQYAIPNGKGNLPATASAAMLPSKYIPEGVAGQETLAHLQHPLNRRWYSSFDNLIPVFLSLQEYQNAQAFLNNKNHNTNVIQDQDPGSDQGRQTAEARRKPLQKAQTQDGGGYSGDRRGARRLQRKAGSSTLSGNIHTPKQRQLRSRYAEGDYVGEGRGGELRTGAEELEGGVFDPLSGERNFDRPRWAINEEAYTCPECEQVSMFLESTSPGASVTTEHYRCANEDCGHTDSFP